MRRCCATWTSIWCLNAHSKIERLTWSVHLPLHLPTPFSPMEDVQVVLATVSCFISTDNFFPSAVPTVWSLLCNSLDFSPCVCCTRYRMSHSRWGVHRSTKSVWSTSKFKGLGSDGVRGPSEDQQTLRTVVQNAVPRDLCTPVMQSL